MYTEKKKWVSLEMETDWGKEKKNLSQEKEMNKDGNTPMWNSAVDDNAAAICHLFVAQ